MRFCTEEGLVTGTCSGARATCTATISLSDLASEQRWPDYIPDALNAGARSSLSVDLPVHESVTGALNLYATQPEAFDEDAIVLAQTFSGYAAVALADATCTTPPPRWPSTCKPRWNTVR
jgi:GAF domain-containing protein